MVRMVMDRMVIQIVVGSNGNINGGGSGSGQGGGGEENLCRHPKNYITPGTDRAEIGLFVGSVYSAMEKTPSWYVVPVILYSILSVVSLLDLPVRMPGHCIQ